MGKKVLRVRPASMGGPCAVYVDSLGTHVVPNPAQPYDEDDPIVQTAPWMFVADEELESAKPEPVESVQIETATQAPGQRRSTRRPQ
jgi:hypothetical protein